MRSEIDAILEAGEMMLNPPSDLAEFIDKPAVRRSRTDQLILLFQQVVARAEDSMGAVSGVSYSEEARFSYNYLQAAKRKAVEDFRQALLRMVGE